MINITIESLEPVFAGGHTGLQGTLSDTAVSQGDYTIIKELQTVFFSSGTLAFKVAAGGGNLLVKISGDRGDFGYTQSIAAEFVVTSGGDTVTKAFDGGVSAIRIEAKRQGSDTGTLSTTLFLTDTG